MSQEHSISGDLIWEIVRNQNAFLVKRKSGGGSQFSRDSFNLVNKHSRKQSGFVNSKAVSIQPHGEKGVTLMTKKGNNTNKVHSSANIHTFGPTTSNRKIYKSVANAVGKNSYRADLTKDAVARASAIRDSQRAKKDAPIKKSRGKATKKAEA